MATNKHYRWMVAEMPVSGLLHRDDDTNPQLVRHELTTVRVPTRAGRRRAKRDRTFVELFATALRNDDSPREAFQAAARMLGSSPKDRRRAWQRIKRAGLA